MFRLKLGRIFVIIILMTGIIYFLFFSPTKQNNFNTNKAPELLKKTKIIKENNNNSEKSSKNLHSFFNNKEDYLDSFAQCDKMKKINFSISPKAGIVSHHFLAKDSIACFFNNISNKNKIKTVVLVGPDHFNSFSENNILFFTTKLKWSTPFGELLPEKDIINSLLKNKTVKKNDSVFQTEHSIYTEVPFIRKVFPKAKIVPLIVRNNFDYSTFHNFGKNILAPLLNSDTILIVSSDFTHHSTNQKARQIDKKSLEALNNLSVNTISQINSDCRACISLMNGYLLRNKNTEAPINNFKLFANQNSTDFGGENKNVTSYIFGYY